MRMRLPYSTENCPEDFVRQAKINLTVVKPWANRLTRSRKKLPKTCIGWPNANELSIGLGLGGQNVDRLACKFDLDQSHRKSSQVNASAPKVWPNRATSTPKFSTCA